ncbi:MAG: hypothetical protein GWN99_06010 [Gemmatimonadetes bacterium]|uniref:DUF4175 family protein n=1 Tax=Candidatus Kutchimonas denitrificans TaxID=3056748 RepID=A0AAE4ZBG5_9BACT|nr:hypothetical protein [Gemmatimonadota bacterium]NIR76177.1 hypothetical protein [Candidatus Kutchimonas denitrificans]NIS00617.1 hypothetical protein [Gemmatimonadota bacterium]NIT66762.1 hypothetical protein [Gemmatimonadota bacterium]NIV23361.1 hypothetical protein [Gemmatimonadota bacterium]
MSAHRHDPAREPAVRVLALWRRVALYLALAALAGVLAAVGAVLVASWAAGGSPAWQRPSPLPLLFWILAAAVAAAWLVTVVVAARRWSQRRAAEEVERRAGLRRGAVLAAIEPGAEQPGTSAELLQLHRARIGERLSDRRVSELGYAFAGRARSRAMLSVGAALLLLLGSLAVWMVGRDSAAQAWAAAAHPIRHLQAPPLPPLRIAALLERVERGEDLPLIVGAPERDSVLIAWKPRGDVATRSWHRVTADRVDAVVPNIEAPTRIWASAPDGAMTDTLAVTPFDPLLLIDVRIDLRFPPHTRREREVYSTPVPALTVPEGTWATVTGTATRQVRRAALRSRSGATLGFELTGERRFRRGFTVRPGAWGWQIVGAEGEPLEGEPDSLHFFTVADSAPRIDVVYPGVDTLLDTSMTQPLVIEAADDYGLSDAELVSWRVSAWGEAWPERVEPLEVDGEPHRVSLSALLDARGRGFLPGDTLYYYVRAYDNAPDRHEGRSREYRLRLPTLDEVRERAIVEAQELVGETEALAERARRQEEAMQALERSTRTQPAPGQQLAPPGSEGDVEFRETEAARRAVDEASRLLEESREIQQAVRELQEAVEASGLNDTTVLERLREIEALYERILTPELRERIEELREALAELDPQRIQEAIRQLAEGSVDFRERVEQTLELLRRAALEQEFARLETQAAELADEHEQLADRVDDSDAASDSAARRLEAQARELARRSEELSERSAELARQLQRAAEDAAGKQAAEAERAAAGAAGSDQSTASSLQRGSQRQASRSAAQAAAQMRQVADALRQGREGMQASWRQEVVQALQRTGTEALELAERQGELTEQMRSADAADREEARSQQAALKRGVDQMGETLLEMARRSLLVDRGLGGQIDEVSELLERLLAQMGDGTRSGGADPSLSERAAEALNEIAYRAMRAGQNAGSASSGTGLQEALQQLAELAQQQGDLNAQAGGLQPGDATDLLLQQLRQLAARQRAIGEDLENLSRDLGPRGQVLGRIDELGREAEELARDLERGRIDREIVERQNRLYNRLLDAGRTLERDEFERDRRAERPREVEVLRPGELPAELLKGPEYPLPDSETLSRYPPALRRLILEYFDRLNRGPSSRAP